jgi:glycine betaine/choline ABC-type transport system substrate-binding protein
VILALLAGARRGGRGGVPALAVAALAAGLLTGCGTGLSALGGGGISGTTTTTATQPVVTTVAQSTVADQTLPGYRRPPILLGVLAGEGPEQAIIGQLYKLALDQQGYRVRIDPNLGPPEVYLTALHQGRLALYPEYLWDWNGSIAGDHQHFKNLKAALNAARAYAGKHHFRLLEPTPFSHTWGIAVTSDYARAHGLLTISDLAGEGNLRLGFTSHVDQGLRAIEQAYGLTPLVQGVDVGRQYPRLASGNLQAAWVSTADPQLSGPVFRLLRDPQRVFGFGNVVPVTTLQVLKLEGPAFAATIDRVDKLLTQQAVRGLNAEYMPGVHSPAAIAQQFLEGNGILPPARFAPVRTSTSAS